MEVEQQFGDQVRIIGVPGLGEVDEFEEFIGRTDSASVDHIPDVEGEIWNRLGITQHRTYVFINDDGTVERRGYGSLEADVQDLIAR